MTSSPSSIAPASGPAKARHANAYSHSAALVQAALDSTGGKCPDRRCLGAATEAALKHYQRQNGLLVTGQLDKATQTTLDPTG